MISKYTHKNIDKNKYTICLQNALNYRIYAELWFLNIVSPDGYDILVLNDYEVIMPIPYQKKLGFKFIIQPPFCQQLGLFYKNKISSNIFNDFFHLLKKYKVRSYCFNEDNTTFFSSKHKKRNNQILPLNLSYDEIFKKFNINRKREINHFDFQKFNLEKQISSEKLIQLIKEQYSFNEDYIDKIQKIIHESHKRNMLEQFTLKSGERVLAHVSLLKSRERLINILPLRNKKEQEKGSISFLLNHIIYTYSKSEKILDFEGSMLLGVFNFNRSLGAENKIYIYYKNFRWFELLKKYIAIRTI